MYLFFTDFYLYFGRHRYPAYFPTVGLRTSGEKILANFGQKPFKFDIISHIKAQIKYTNIYIRTRSRVFGNARIGVYKFVFVGAEGAGV